MIRVNPLQGRAKRRVAATLAALAVLASASAGMADRADAKAPREFFGVVPSIAPTSADYAQMKAMGVGTLRTLLAWPVIEPSPGMYDWTYFDEVVAGAAQQGIQVFPTIFGSPDWPNVLDGRGACGAGCAVDGPQGNDAFTAFIQAAVRRYGPNGEFWNGASGNCVVPPLCPEGPGCGCGEPLPIRTWQVWNEQNSPKYFHPNPNPAAYAGLVQTASSAIRSVDPGAEVVLGGMWGPTDTDAVIPTPRFLKRFYAVPGIEDTFDSIAVHPYSPTLAGMKEQMKRARAVMRKSGDGGAGIWVTELGWASGGPRDEGLVKTPKAQGRLLDKAFRYLLEKRKAWKIRGVTWYSWRDAPAQQTDCRWCPRAGLRKLAGGQKPAGALFRKLALTFGRR